jgi:putative solute:sodium symporter small subunit
LEASSKNYDFSLFKPVSLYGRKNRNLILILGTIWFVAIFGFQLLLLIFQKPTPEKTLITFESVWDNVKSEKATEREKNDFLNSLIAVAGKSSVKPDDKKVIMNSISWSVYNSVSDSEKVILSEQVRELGNVREKLLILPDEEYITLKSNLQSIKATINAIANEKTGVDPTNNKAAILPYSLNLDYKELTASDKEALPKIMKLYLTHNQSFLTDIKILGFPFHYFYTAEFLLILFVGLSLFYSIRITHLQKEFSIKEE